MIRTYHSSVQRLAHEVPPRVHQRDLRQDGCIDEVEDLIVRFGNYYLDEAEGKGVLHLSHGWMMQGHPYGVRSTQASIFRL